MPTLLITSFFLGMGASSSGVTFKPLLLVRRRELLRLA